jgi:hypothetical protein
MNKRLTLVLLLLFFSATFSCAFSQANNADSVQSGRIAVNMADLFNKAIGQQSGIYNGPMFDPYNFISKTNANFKDTTAFTNGSVNYDGLTYNNVPLIYNLDRDVLVSQLYNSFSQYTLLSDRVYEFDILGHHFIRLLPDSLNKQMDAGFYDELYYNKLLLLARRTKSVQQESSVNRIVSIFVEKNNYFLKKGAKYYNVNSQGKFFDLLKDKKKELKQYLKNNKIRFNDNPEHAMAILAAYYDHLTN